MNNLCYVATPQDWESPKGVLMRTALHNGYQTVAAMCGIFGVPCEGNGLKLLTEHSSLLTIISSEAPQISRQLSINVYSTNDPHFVHWCIDDVVLHHSEFAHHFRYCPICLADELITIFSDLEDLSICPIHQIQIVTRCPHCQTYEHWTKANLLYCKCGFDRRTAKSRSIILIDVNRLEVFGPQSYIGDLSAALKIALTCDSIWQSRNSLKEKNKNSLADIVYKHASTMLIKQMAVYPGFTRVTHLAPWISNDTPLVTLANEILKEKSTLNAKCVYAVCCGQVELTINQLIYSAGGNREWLKDKVFFARNFDETQRKICGRFYRCHTRLCRIISKINAPPKENVAPVYLTTSEAGKLLECSKKIVVQLAELGYLTYYYHNGIRGKQPSLIHRQSIINFNKSYTLLNPIASKLKINRAHTVRLLNQQGIASDHSKLAPHVYETHKIHAAWEKLEIALANPTRLFPIVLPPTQNINNTIAMTFVNKDTSKEPNPCPTRMITQPRDMEEPYTYTTQQVASLLNVGVRLIHYRFFLPGLITPKLKEATPYYSLSQIQTMDNHLHQHMTLEQITRHLNCGYEKASHLINIFDIQPSHILAYSNGNLQLLYYKTEISKLKTIATTKQNEEQIASTMYRETLKLIDIL